MAIGATIRLIGFVVGLLVVLGTSVNVFTTLIVPRATSSRLLRSITRVMGVVVRAILRRVATYGAKDRLMAVVAPLAMMALFIAWLGALMLGFGLVAWWTGHTSLTHGLAIAGSSVTTLGIATGAHAPTTVLEVVAATMGLLVIALEIAYLPTLYSAFVQREAEVTLLATRAGTPAWGPEVLARHHWFATMSELPELYRAWERWSAEISESHCNYPTLMFFRSPVAARSWLTALCAVLDASALHDAVSPSSAPPQARLCLIGGTSCLRALGTTLRIDYDPDPLPTDGIRLRFEEFAEGYHRLEAVGFPLERTVEEAWRHFAGWRVNYEAIVDGLTLAIMPPPAPWFLDRPSLGEAVRPRLLDRTPDDPAATHDPR